MQKGGRCWQSCTPAHLLKWVSIEVNSELHGDQNLAVLSRPESIRQAMHFDRMLSLTLYPFPINISKMSIRAIREYFEDIRRCSLASIGCLNDPYLRTFFIIIIISFIFYSFYFFFSAFQPEIIFSSTTKSSIKIHHGFVSS